MPVDHNEIALLSEESMRNRRLVRGLQAVVASVIVGGLGVVAVETMLPPGRSVTANAPAAPAPARSVPLAAPAGARTDAAPAPAAGEPLLQRIEHSVTDHG